MTLPQATMAEKLAVDLIMLLEDNQIAAEIVLAALEIVRRDYLCKQAAAKPLPCEEKPM